MNIKIRNGAFETNSSSTHSIVIRKDINTPNEEITREEAIEDLNATAVDEDKPVVHDGIFDFTRLGIDSSDDFGWGLCTFSDFSHKLLYAAIDLYHDDNDITDETSSLHKLLEFIKTFLGVDTIILPEMSDDEKEDARSWNNAEISYNFGTIDHQSRGTVSDIRESGHTIKEFLLNKDFYLIIDNDNH